MCLPLPLIFLYLNEEKKRTKKAELQATKTIKREAQLKMALEAGELGVWDWDIPNDILKIYDETPGLYKDDNHVLTFQPSDLWNKHVRPDDLNSFERGLNSYLNGDTGLFKSEYRFKRPGEKNHIWITNRGKVIERDENGKPIRLVGIYMDIDKRKKAEEEL